MCETWRIFVPRNIRWLLNWRVVSFGNHVKQHWHTAFMRDLLGSNAHYTWPIGEWCHVPDLCDHKILHSTLKLNSRLVFLKLKKNLRERLNYFLSLPFIYSSQYSFVFQGRKDCGPSQIIFTNRFSLPGLIQKYSTAAVWHRKRFW